MNITLTGLTTPSIFQHITSHPVARIVAITSIIALAILVPLACCLGCSIIHFKAKEVKENDLNGKNFNDLNSNKKLEENVTGSTSNISDDEIQKKYNNLTSNNDSTNNVNSEKIDWKKFDKNTKTILNSSDNKIEQENSSSHDEHDELKERFKNLTSDNDSSNNINSEKIDWKKFDNNTKNNKN